LLLGFAAVRFKVEGDPIVEKIDAVLPQTQCGQCGYAGCRPYAEAIAAGDKAAANKQLQESQAVIDRVADKKIIHKNMASRTKSRLSQAIKALA
jgi:electron transport complex protein RnfB